MKWVRNVFLLGVVCVCSGCLSRGLHRTNLEKWERREFPSIGISLEMPRKAERVIVGGDFRRPPPAQDRSAAVVLIWFHPIHTSYEPFYVVKVEFNRLPPDRYKAFREYRPFIDHPGFSVLRNGIWTHSHDKEYTSTESFDWVRGEGHYSIKYRMRGWRRDYRCANGDMIVGAGKYLRLTENEPFAEGDFAAIERILASVRELEP